MQKKYKINQNGKTMMETILYLGVVGVFGLGIFYTIQKIFSSVSSSKSVSDFVVLVDNIFSRYAVEGNYENLTTANLIKDRVVPSDMIIDDRIINAKGDEISVAKHDSDEGIFVVTVNKTAQDECIDYLGINWMPEKGASLNKIILSRIALPEEQTDPDAADETISLEFSWSQTDDYDADVNLPMDPIAIAKACGSSNDITWEFN